MTSNDLWPPWKTIGIIYPLRATNIPSLKFRQLYLPIILPSRVYFTKLSNVTKVLRFGLALAQPNINKFIAEGTSLSTPLTTISVISVDTAPFSCMVVDIMYSKSQVASRMFMICKLLLSYSTCLHTTLLHAQSTVPCPVTFDNFKGQVASISSKSATTFFSDYWRSSSSKPNPFHLDWHQYAHILRNPFRIGR